MFDVGFWELTIIGIVALVIVGPERLPKLARTAGLWIGKGRRMIADVKRDIDREIKASELSELKEDLDTAREEVSKAGETIKKASEAEEIKSSVNDAIKEVEPARTEVQSEMDEIDEISTQMDAEMTGTSGVEDAATSSGTEETTVDVNPPEEKPQTG